MFLVMTSGRGNHRRAFSFLSIVIAGILKSDFRHVLDCHSVDKETVV